jgi:protein ImuB
MPCWIALHTSVTAEPGGPVMVEAAVQRAVACLALGFTPRVALVEELVLMDVTGSLRLFGGPLRLMDQLGLQISHFFKSNKLGSHTDRAQAATSLIATGRLRSARSGAVNSPRRTADLPMHTLSAARPHLGVLERIGCRNWGDLLALPRGGSARRFGSALFDALDRASGLVPDQYDWLTLPEQFDEKIELDALVTHAPALMAGAECLLLQLQAWLLGRQSGLTALRLIWHLDKRRDVAPTGELEIRTANPAQDLRHVARLVAEHLAQQKLPAPVHSLRLQSLETQQLADSAAATGSLLLEAQHAGSSAVELIERLAARLGDANVRAWQPQADHRPEQMQRWESARSALPVAIKSGAACARTDWAGDLKSLKKELKKGLNRSAVAAGPTSSTTPASRAGRLGESVRSVSSGRAGRIEALYPSWLLPKPLMLATFGNSPMYQGRLQRLAGPQRLEATGWALKQPPRSLTACSSLPPEGAARLRPGEAGSAPGAGLGKEPSRSFASRNSLPSEGAPAVWQSQSRGPLLEGKPLSSLELVPLVIACAPDLLPLLSGERSARQGIPAPVSLPQSDPAENNQPPAIRDYFIYRSQQGALLWIYSERLQREQAGQAALRPARTWYLHGFFA